jgi:Dolichyl-phosphate-mannose-protein mannosyltransferase
MQRLKEPLPLITRERSWARWELPTLFGLLSLYLALATYKIHLPGLYGDEMLFVGPAAGERPYLKCFGLPLLIFPYIGALKSWIYTPVFALFGVSPVSIRLPAILISCGTLALGYSLVRRILTPGWAVAFTGACAVHPGFVLLTRVDLGPIALMLFLKALCLVLLFKWLDGPQRICWSVFGVCLLGFFDKFNFIWFIVALAFSTSAIYGAEIFRKLRTVPVRVLVGIAIALVAVGSLVLWIIYPLLQRPHVRATFSGRFSQMWSLYESTSTGAGTAFLWFKSPPAVPFWSGWGVLGVTAIFLLLALVSYGLGRSANRNVDTRTLRFCLWCLLMFGIILLEIVLTPQAGGPHHLIMLFPFDLLAGFSAAFLFANAWPRMRRQIVLLEGCVLIIWVASNLRSFDAHFTKFGDISSFRGRWSPHVQLLAAYLNEKAKNVDSIYTTDWGIGFELTALCRRKIGRKVKDSWPTFLGWSADRPDAAAEITRVFPPEKTALYVSFVSEESVFPQALQNFERMRAMAGNTTKTVSNVSPAIAETYQIFEKPASVVDRR